MRRKRFGLIGLIMWAAASLCACRPFGGILLTAVPLAATSASEIAVSGSVQEVAFAVPADWLLYRGRRSAFGFYYPPEWQIEAERANSVAFSTPNDATIQLAVMDPLCGIGQDDLPQEQVLDCLAGRGASALDYAAEGTITGQNLLFSQGHWLYTVSYAVPASFAGPSGRRYLLAAALPDGQMVAAIYRAAVLGPQTRRDLEQVVASFHLGSVESVRITPTPQPTATEYPAQEARITLQPGATVKPAVVPGNWPMIQCVACELTVYYPPDWELLRQESDHILWDDGAGGLIVIGVGLASCDMTSSDSELTLECLAQVRAAEAPPNADYALLASDIMAEGDDRTYILIYRSSTPDDGRPLYGIACYRLLEDHRLLAAEYAAVGRALPGSASENLLSVFQSIRVSAGPRITPTPQPEPTPQDAHPAPTRAWLEAPQPIAYRQVK